MRSTSLHEFRNILYTLYVRETCERTELKALGMGDCNFTHGVTHCSTLYLSAYLSATGSLPRCILPSLFVASSPMCFAFVRWMYKCNICHGIFVSVSRCFSLSLILSLSSLFSFIHLIVIVILRHPLWQAKSSLYCQPLSDGPELIRIRRWKRDLLFQII